MNGDQIKKVKVWERFSAARLCHLYGGVDGVVDLINYAIIIRFDMEKESAMYFDGVKVGEFIADIYTGEECYLVGYYEEQTYGHVLSELAVPLKSAIARYALLSEDFYVINMNWGDVYDIGTYALDELRCMAGDPKVYVVSKELIDGNDSEYIKEEKPEE